MQSENERTHGIQGETLGLLNPQTKALSRVKLELILHHKKYMLYDDVAYTCEMLYL